MSQPNAMKCPGKRKVNFTGLIGRPADCSLSSTTQQYAWACVLYVCRVCVCADSIHCSIGTS